MPNIKNTQGIDEITFYKELTLFCPMGEALYNAEIDVTITPGDEIMDYCETDAFLQSLDGQAMIIEDLVEKVYSQIVEGIKPLEIQVEVCVPKSAHMPVTLTKVGSFV